MGLAPYGEPIHTDKIINNLIDIKDDGTFRLDQKYFNYATGLSILSIFLCNFRLELATILPPIFAFLPFQVVIYPPAFFIKVIIGWISQILL